MGEVFITRKGGGGKAAAPTIAITDVGGTWIEVEITNNDGAATGAQIFVLANYDPTSATDFDIQAAQNGYVFSMAQRATVTQLVTGLDPDTSHTVSASAAVIKKLPSSIVTTDTINLAGTGVTAPTVGPIVSDTFVGTNTTLTIAVANSDTTIPLVIKANFTTSTTPPTTYPFETASLAAGASTNLTLTGLTTLTTFYIHAKAFDGQFESSNVVFGPYTTDGNLYEFTTATFTVSRSIANNFESQQHRFGPTQSEVLSYLNNENYTWANQFVDVPIQGYQRWTVPSDGLYSFEIKGGNAGATDQNSRGRACRVTANFNLQKNNKLLLCVGQGVPDRIGDHCNGGGGATWVALGENYQTAIPLLVANGGPGDTSDGSAKQQPNTTFNRNVNVSGVTGIETTPILSNASIGFGGTLTAGMGNVASGGWLTSGGSNFSGSQGAGFRQGLTGGTRNNATAGYGGFGGGSGGFDESGNASGGFTGASGQDDTAQTGVGSSFVNDLNLGNVSCRLSDATTTYQNSNFKGENQYQGYITIARLS